MDAPDGTGTDAAGPHGTAATGGGPAPGGSDADRDRLRAVVQGLAARWEEPRFDERLVDEVHAVLGDPGLRRYWLATCLTTRGGLDGDPVRHSVPGGGRWALGTTPARDEGTAPGWMHPRDEDHRDRLHLAIRATLVLGADHGLLGAWVLEVCTDAVPAALTRPPRWPRREEWQVRRRREDARDGLGSVLRRMSTLLAARTAPALGTAGDDDAAYVLVRTLAATDHGRGLRSEEHTAAVVALGPHHPWARDLEVRTAHRRAGDRDGPAGAAEALAQAAEEADRVTGATGASPAPGEHPGSWRNRLTLHVQALAARMLVPGLTLHGCPATARPHDPAAAVDLLAHCTRDLGDDDPTTLLARTCALLPGDDATALAGHAARCVQVLGRTHATVAATHGALAAALVAQVEGYGPHTPAHERRTAARAAVRAARAASAGYEALHGRKDALAVLARADLGAVLLRTGRPAAAIAPLAEADQRAVHALVNRSPWHRALTTTLAEAHRRCSRTGAYRAVHARRARAVLRYENGGLAPARNGPPRGEDTRRRLEDALAEAELHLGPGHPVCSQLRRVLALGFAYPDDTAVAHLRTDLHERVAADGPRHRRTARARLDLGRYLTGWGHEAEAAAVLRELLETLPRGRTRIAVRRTALELLGEACMETDPAAALRACLRWQHELEQDLVGRTGKGAARLRHERTRARWGVARAEVAMSGARAAGRAAVARLEAVGIGADLDRAGHRGRSAVGPRDARHVDLAEARALAAGGHLHLAVARLDAMLDDGRPGAYMHPLHDCHGTEQALELELRLRRAAARALLHAPGAPDAPGAPQARTELQDLADEASTVHGPGSRVLRVAERLLAQVDAGPT